jgi:hypothetical protein
MEDYTQAGGARFGRSFWFAWNFTSPFAHLRIASNSMVLTVSVFRLWQRTFTFRKTDLRQLRWKRGLFSTGLQISHAASEYPPFVLFWPLDRCKLKEQLKAFDYEISECP